jgi:hypothetical protein
MKQKYVRILLILFFATAGALAHSVRPGFCEGRNIWSIGIYTGTDPFRFYPHPAVNNPVLTAADVTDVPALFVADPFMIDKAQTWYMFFEVLNAASGQGDIAYAVSRDGLKWRYQRVVIDEPFHLSFPYLFEWRNAVYIMPESRRTSSVRLYRAVDFPHRWTFVRELIRGEYADPSIVFWEGIWWLFALKGSDTLTLHYADRLAGPWKEHPRSPLVVGDKNISRPAGRLVVHRGKIIRYTQDGDPTYGNQVRAFLVDRLTKRDYREHEIDCGPVLAAGACAWHRRGMHHIDAHPIGENRWIGCVDGLRKEEQPRVEPKSTIPVWTRPRHTP